MNTAELSNVALHLFSCAVNGREADLPQPLCVEDWQLVLGVLAAQNVHTFVYDYLPQGVPAQVLSVWEKQVRLVEKHNERCAQLASSQKQAWTAAGLDFALLKGESLSRLYPYPLHRGGSDIDWYFPTPASWEKSCGIAKAQYCAQMAADSDGDLHYFVDGITVEHHRDWTHLSGRFRRRKAGTPQIAGGVLCPEDCLLSLLAHLLHHIAWKGSSLKQLADIGIALRSFCGSYDKAAFERRMDSLGLRRWCSVVFAALLQIKAVDESCLPIAPAAGSGLASRLLAVVLADGVASHRGGNMLISRIILMGCCCPGEMLARYWHLVAGKLRKLSCK